MKKKNLKVLHLKKRLIANMTINNLEALKGGTRPSSEGLLDDLETVDLTFCPGHLVCDYNISE